MKYKKSMTVKLVSVEYDGKKYYADSEGVVKFDPPLPNDAVVCCICQPIQRPEYLWAEERKIINGPIIELSAGEGE